MVFSPTSEGVPEMVLLLSVSPAGMEMVYQRCCWKDRPDLKIGAVSEGIRITEHCNCEAKSLINIQCWSILF